MKVIVTGTRDLEMSEPFYSRAKALGRKVADRKRETLGRELTAPELADAFRTADAQASKWARDEVHHVLAALHRDTPVSLLVEGGAQGVDRFAGAWAVANGVPVKVYKPKWMKDGVLDRGAGYSRNWWMMFTEAGKKVSDAHKTKTGALALLTAAILKEVEEAKRLKQHERLVDAVRHRELLADVSREDRRETLERLSIPLPEGVQVHAFWDGESRGTSHAMFVARTLGYEVVVHEYPRYHAEYVETDRAKIDHRPGELPEMGECGPLVTR